MTPLASTISSATQLPLCINNVISLKTIANQVEFYHAAYGSPSPSTFINAIARSFIHLPGLTTAQVRKYTPNTFPSMAGHLDQQRQQPRRDSPETSSPPSIPLPYPDDHDDTFLPVPAVTDVSANAAHLILAPRPASPPVAVSITATTLPSVSARGISARAHALPSSAPCAPSRSAADPRRSPA